MENKRDLMEQIITEDLLNEAEAIDREIEDAEIEIPMGLKDEMREMLHAQISEYEKENIYAQLSAEDREALKLGREMIQDKRVFHRKSKKMYVALVAVAVLVLAMGVTSIGGAERIAKMMKSIVGPREVIKINTDEDNYIVRRDKEEEAYQKLRDMFGVEVVKPVEWPKNAEFISVEMDYELQTALLKYECQGKNISYYINAFYADTSWGMDIEDTVTDEYNIEHEKCEIEIKEYETPETKTKRYSAKYVYEGVEYNLIGVMEKVDFEHLVKNLLFF